MQVRPEWDRPYLMDNGWTFDDYDLDLITRPGQTVAERLSEIARSVPHIPGITD